jgi:hypothetical protein
VLLRRKRLLLLCALVLLVAAGALCCGGTSESVRMLREMAAEEVGRDFGPGCYILVVCCRGWD